MANDVRITLTNEQKAKIKEATGKDLGETHQSRGEITVVGNNPAVTPKMSAKVVSARVQAAPRLNTARAQAAPKMTATRVQAAPRLNTARAQAAPKIFNARTTQND